MIRSHPTPPPCRLCRPSLDAVLCPGLRARHAQRSPPCLCPPRSPDQLLEIDSPPASVSMGSTLSVPLPPPGPSVSSSVLLWPISYTHVYLYVWTPHPGHRSPRKCLVHQPLRPTRGLGSRLQASQLCPSLPLPPSHPGPPQGHLGHSPPANVTCLAVYPGGMFLGGRTALPSRKFPLRWPPSCGASPSPSSSTGGAVTLRGGRSTGTQRAGKGQL